jgi:hypothetical protein
MSGPYRDPRPGVFLLRGEATIAFRQGSMIEYEAASGIVTVKTAVHRETSLTQTSPYGFEPAAWFMLEEGMLVSFANEPHQLTGPVPDRPYILRGGRYFGFGRARSFSIGSDVVIFEDRPTPLAEDPGWPQQQIVYLLRLGPGVIFVDGHADRPMEVGVESAVPLVSR